jgi:hypothetical protein
VVCVQHVLPDSKVVLESVQKLPWPKVHCFVGRCPDMQSRRCCSGLEALEAFDIYERTTHTIATGPDRGISERLVIQ